MSLKKHWFWGAAALVVIGAVLVTQQGNQADAKSDAPKLLPAVRVGTAQTLDLPVQIQGQGHLVALNRVDVRPQITGIIRSVHFREGEDIHAGQLLFEIDQSEAKAQLSRTQAQAAQIKAQLDDADRDYHRSTELVKAGFISPSAADTSASKVESLRAQYEAALAEAETAKVQLGHTRILSPIAARAGAVDVHPGSLAEVGGSVPLVTLLQFDPIGVEFSLPESQLTSILKGRSEQALHIQLNTPDGRQVEGQLTFIDNTVNRNTGTINLKASFPNASGTLWPGAFVRVDLQAGLDRNATVLPPQALIEGPTGHFVYVLNDANEVNAQPVTLLRIQDEQAVVEGLSGTPRVVIEGNRNLRAGMKVQVRS
ncbi:efflux RND transporter periplasmic adaptor subunit [Steroidobacter flavus]|uniref:Efflux RND transporter periplasmic adaptor subunit n=1 Tax=Steroidobacter flavus TaxID=1842136 RepID=A0ABV8SMG6_9GAMM